MTDIRGRMTDIRGRMTDVRGRMADVRGRMADVRGQMTEGYEGGKLECGNRNGGCGNEANKSWEDEG